jgi:hypothetical protein
VSVKCLFDISCCFLSIIIEGKDVSLACLLTPKYEIPNVRSLQSEGLVVELSSLGDVRLDHHLTLDEFNEMWSNSPQCSQCLLGVPCIIKLSIRSSTFAQLMTKFVHACVSCKGRDHNIKTCKSNKGDQHNMQDKRETIPRHK